MGTHHNLSQLPETKKNHRGTISCQQDGPNHTSPSNCKSKSTGAITTQVDKAHNILTICIPVCYISCVQRSTCKIGHRLQTSDVWSHHMHLCATNPQSETPHSRMKLTPTRHI
uniref:Uncharacterized protein n=1 Tax=Eutreptiella gymnastica TaxID=73025 RepID=A0A7S1N1W0_9EUGL